MTKNTRRHQSGELKGTILLFLGITVPLLWGCFYVMHRGAVETQSVIDQAALLRHERHPESDLDQLTQLPSDVAAQLANAARPSLERSTESEDQSSEQGVPPANVTISPELIDRLSSALTTARPKVEAPEVSLAASAPSPPVAIYKPRDDDSDGSGHEDVVWAHAPKNFTPSSDDFIHVQAPGVDLSGIKVTGIANDSSGVTWLLQVNSKDASTLKKIIHHRPKKLRVSSEES